MLRKHFKVKIAIKYLKENLYLYGCFFILAAFNFNNPDYAGYKEAYEMDDGRFEILFSSFISLFSKAGFSYRVFLCFFAALSIWQLALAIHRYTNADWKVLLLIIISPLGLLVTQIRSLMAFALLYHALGILFDDKGMKKTADIKYIACIVIAYGFHRIMIFYIVYLAAKRLKPVIIIITAGIVIAVTSSLLAAPVQLREFLRNIDFIVPQEKSLYYLTESHIRPNLNGLIASYTLYLVALCTVLVLLYSEFMESKRQCSCRRGFLWFCNNTTIPAGYFFRCYLMTSIVLPFDMYDTTFERLYFYLYPFIYILSIDRISKCSSLQNRQKVIAAVALLSLFGLFYMIYVNGNLNSIVIPLFRDNYFIQPWRWFIQGDV